MMDRRAVLAGAAATFVAPRLAWAQDPQRHRIALVDRGEQIANMSMDGNPRWSALLKEFHRLGYVEGETITVERWSSHDHTNEQFAQLAHDVANSQPDIVVARGLRAIVNFQSAATTVSVVGVGTFPADFHGRLARPGGNITGIDISGGGALYAKMVQLLHDAVPSLSRIGYLGPREWWDDERLGGSARAGAAQLNLPLVPVIVERPLSEAAIQSAFATLAGQEFDAVYVASELDFLSFHRTTAALVLAAGLPAISLQRRYAEAGLLMTYSSNQPDLYRRAAGYVDRILKGAEPADMPIEKPTEFDFIVNLKTARELGITLPPEILIQATELIE